MNFIELLKNIEQLKIKFLVVGGIAVNLHGIERPTKDLDLIIYLEKRNLLRFINLMKRLGFIPKIPVNPVDFADAKKRQKWIKQKNMIVFSFIHQDNIMRVIDVFVKHPLPFDAMYKRKIMVRIGNFEIPVISIPDLIKLKQKADRLQDQADIRALKEVLKIKKEFKNEKK